MIIIIYSISVSGSPNIKEVVNVNRQTESMCERALDIWRNLLLEPQVWLINLSSSNHQLLLHRRELHLRAPCRATVTETGFAPVTHGKMRLSRVSQMRVNEGNLPKHLASSFHGQWSLYSGIMNSASLIPGCRDSERFYILF